MKVEVAGARTAVRELLFGPEARFISAECVELRCLGQLRVAGAIDFAHSAGAGGGKNLVRPEFLTDCEGHARVLGL